MDASGRSQWGAGKRAPVDRSWEVRMAFYEVDPQAEGWQGWDTNIGDISDEALPQEQQNPTGEEEA
jgi:hypothetical protein